MKSGLTFLGSTYTRSRLSHAKVIQGGWEPRLRFADLVGVDFEHDLCRAGLESGLSAPERDS